MDRATTERVAQVYQPAVWTRGELYAAGMTRRSLDLALREGVLTRIRRNRYARPGVDAKTEEAIRIGGRITCVTLLAALGVFIQHSECLHVELPHDASRIRSPRDPQTVLHWVRNAETNTPLHVAAVSDAVREATRCQEPRAALATLDSVIHLGVLDHAQVLEILAGLPERYRALCPLIDGSAESGPETYTRLILRSLGSTFRAQVVIHAVGRVDFLVDGWLIIECDSVAHHAGWEKQQADRARDISAARQGYVTIRFLAADIMHRPDWVRDAIRDVLARGRSGAGVPHAA